MTSIPWQPGSGNSEPISISDGLVAARRPLGVPAATVSTLGCAVFALALVALLLTLITHFFFNARDLLPSSSGREWSAGRISCGFSYIAPKNRMCAMREDKMEDGMPSEENEQIAEDLEPEAKKKPKGPKQRKASGKSKKGKGVAAAAADSSGGARPGDPGFDLTSIRLSTNYAETVGVRQAIVTVPVCKPNRQVFVRVHPGPGYQLETAVLEDKETRETYLVAPELWPELPGEIVPKLLVTAITRQGHVFLWPIRLPGEDGRLDQWNRTALQAAELAKLKWIRIAGNMAIGTYDVFEATNNLGEPEWPGVTFAELVGKAFNDNYIDSLSHPVLQRLRGEK